MLLKNYQIRVLREFEAFLNALAIKEQALHPTYAALRAAGASLSDPAEAAWREIFPLRRYVRRDNSLGEPVPNVCLKVPTGGGKTLIACHALGSINRVYRHSNSGMVLWIVPTEQIYKQTLKALKDRSHPYREALDKASAGRTKIVEKDDKFEPEDARDSLVVLLMMLQAANRRDKDYLKAFKDSGRFQSFFPELDRYDLQAPLIEQHGLSQSEGDMFERRGIKTSLGNVMKVLRPVMILDEGQKASSFLARDTIFSLNPSLVIEFTATPIEKVSNTLVGIGGLEVLDEGMIKLDMHVTTKASDDWKDTLRESLAKWESLKKEADALHSNRKIYIRPICLIQAERTGKDQRDGRRVHSEDARDFLVKECGRKPEEVAVKSSSLDELAKWDDLLSSDCPVNFIITKRALQEGWDCPFAYILTILTNPNATLAITQLVGRILRQPYAVKTGVRDLDECYVICRRSKTRNLMEEIRNALKDEGLGELASQIKFDIGDEGRGARMIEIGFRKKFMDLADNIYLPRFVVVDGSVPRSLDYEMDLLRVVNWSGFDLSFVESYAIFRYEAADIEEAISLADNPVDVIRRRVISKKVVYLEPDPVFIARQISDIVPNPWAAFGVADGCLNILLKNNKRHLVGSNLNLFLEELRRRLIIFRDEQAKVKFKEMLDNETLKFYLLKDTEGRHPKRSMRFVPEDVAELRHSPTESLQKSLWEIEDSTDFNTLERDVALCLDKQAKLLYWYRNYSRAGYSIQGWQEYRIYADLIAESDPNDEVDEHSRVLVMETKGSHSTENPDTKYKEKVFKTIMDLGEIHEWNALGLKFPGKKFVFKVVHEASWERQIRELIGD